MGPYNHFDIQKELLHLDGALSEISKKFKSRISEHGSSSLSSIEVDFKILLENFQEEVQNTMMILDRYSDRNSE